MLRFTSSIEYWDEGWLNVSCSIAVEYIGAENVEAVDVTEKYKNELEYVRQDLTLLDNYRFVKGVPNTKHYERLRLNIAIYNDLKQTDYEIVKFLFTEEKKWREYDEEKEGDVDNVYFCALILTFFNIPEVIWLFFETKNIDFDSGIGFDGEYLVAFGIHKTYQYLQTVDNPLKAELLEYIGETEENCEYSQEDIDSWKEHRSSYFRSYEYPIEDELYFLYSTNERELFLAKFPNWIKKERTWTYEELGLYKSYAKYTGDKDLEIEALELTLKKNDQNFLRDIYKIKLAQLYIDTGQNTKAFGILEFVGNITGNENTIRDAVEQLCRIIIDETDKKSKVAKQAYMLIKVQQTKYGSFSPHVDACIESATGIMKQNDKRPWWKKLLGFA